MRDSHKVRLNRMFNESGKCLDVAIDHGVFNEYSFLDGLEDVERVVGQLVAAGPDAIQMNYGQCDALQTIPGKHKPALVLRTDVGNPYNPQTHRVMFNILQNAEEPILEALRMDAACVVVNLLRLPDEPELHRQTVANISRLRGACDQYGMPLMIEPLVMQANSNKGGYQVDGDKTKIVPLVRQARELGADLIKADPTDHPEDYHEVIAAARCPVLVRGGGKANLREVLERSYAFLQQGAMGLVYGRNIYQHPNPSRVVQAFMALIHQNATPDEAWALYESGAEGA
ncbi:MAG: aldolase [Anaerolineae bacterium]|nr:aldolase [Anaerolineae bacterium]